MNFNFYEKYKDYSTFDLLLIVRKTNEFQTAAVEAAVLLLSQREITEEEMLEVDNYLIEVETESQKRKQKKILYKEKITDFLNPLLRPGTDIKPGKWLKILLLVIALQYCWSLYATIKNFVNFINCRYCQFEIITFFQFVNLIYIPVIFFLLYKKRTWGWILLFADNLFSVILILGQAFLFFSYQNTVGDADFIWQIAIKGAFIFFLLQEEILTFFQVKKKAKTNTVKITVIGSLLFIATVYVTVA